VARCAPLARRAFGVHAARAVHCRACSGGRSVYVARRRGADRAGGGAGAWESLAY
jgi:hypothetical protein